MYQDTLVVGERPYQYTSLSKLAKSLTECDINALPFTQKILLENALRHNAPLKIVQALARPNAHTSNTDINFMPARVLMQDFTGVPAIVDLAAMRDAVKVRGGNPEHVNPLIPVDLVIDHSVIVDAYGSANAFNYNVKREYERNAERYRFLHWGQKAFRNFRVVPPGTGICHQVNLEYLAQVVFEKTNEDGSVTLYPDSLVGTDSHTTMVNALSVLGWGVGGIEAEAVMLGQPLSMVIPEVIGFELKGALCEGLTATDLVLAVTQILRSHGVVGKFVEFFGDGLDHLTLADRATISNMAPEYGATCGFFPIDEEVLRYLRFTGRSESRVAVVEAYAKAQGLWRYPSTEKKMDIAFSQTLSLCLNDIKPAIAGPKRPQDRVDLDKAADSCAKAIAETRDAHKGLRTVRVSGESYSISDGDVVIAAITSCTNTSNPFVLVAAGLLARKARAMGLSAKPWVKTSLAPGSKVVVDYLKAAGLLEDLEAVGFYLVGYGCTTCIGNSGPLHNSITRAIESEDLTVTSVLSGNRNFEGRVNPHVKANYLASPPLVVAYALLGTMLKDLTKDAIGMHSETNQPIYLKDIWPSNREVLDAIASSMTPAMFKTQYAQVFDGDDLWKSFDQKATTTYAWDSDSTYVQHPPYFEMENFEISDIQGARILALLGDSITTDHISPAGAIKPDSPAGAYLIEKGVDRSDFNAYGTRRGNHEVMIRGTFGNIRLRNEIAVNDQEPHKIVQGGFTRHYPSGDFMTIYDAAQKYQSQNVPLIVIGGKEYGTGSSRDWAAKGTRLLGVKAVVAESFERIHRSNLLGMGVLPLTFQEGTSRRTLELDGSEKIAITGLSGGLKPRMSTTMHITYKDGRKATASLTLAIYTEDEQAYYAAGGILPYVMQQLVDGPA